MKFPVVTFAALCCAIGSGCGEGPTMNWYSHQVTYGEPRNIGISCGPFGHGGSATSGTIEDNGYVIEEVTDDFGLIVRIRDGKKITDEHSFDRDFFESGKLNRFVLTASSGEQFSYSVWGADECQECPTEPYEPLPGDSECAHYLPGLGDGGTEGSAGQ